VDGPAWEGADDRKEWWFNGEEVGEEAVMAKWDEAERAVEKERLVGRLQELALGIPEKVTF
jgi:hypothetical protein